ncbi:kinase-like protein [Apiospora hydei]|uniref:Kinase-like protein n=1 Tax=Apiospora hydei TaxID=1337664 RepID=A0ABR1VN08_9PEZI
MPERAENTRPKTPWDGSIYNLRIVGMGRTSIVFAVDSSRVIKVPIRSSFCLKAIDQEREVYRRLEKDKSIYVLSCHDPDFSSGILLEKCVGSVRDRLRLMGQGDGIYPAIGSEHALAHAERWAYQAAQGLAFVHDHGIIQADGKCTSPGICAYPRALPPMSLYAERTLSKVGCHNMLLDEQNNLKLADFSGSSIENTNYRTLVIYDLRSRLSTHNKPDRLSDLFALGCALYEMAKGHLPYHDLPPKQVQHCFSHNQYPPLGELRQKVWEVAEAIEGCWNVKTRGGFTSAKDVAAVLKLRYKSMDEIVGRGHLAKPQWVRVNGYVADPSLLEKEEAQWKPWSFQ